jgi:heme/copper-type cytochrome/quinol oxidase subunit 1
MFSGGPLMLQQLALAGIVLFGVVVLAVWLEQGSGLSRPTPQTLLMALGVVLLFIGVTIVVVQLYLEVRAGYPAMNDLTSGEQLKLLYLGSAIAGLGAVLEVIAFVATRYWEK